MKLKTLTTALLFFILLCSCNNEDLNNDVEDVQVCDNGTFVGWVTLKTQQEVNDFGALCYTKIDGTLSIYDNAQEIDKILDLSPLINLTEVYSETYIDSLSGSLYISTTELATLNGLNNLNHIGQEDYVGRMSIIGNSLLENINGLEGLTEIITSHTISGLGSPGNLWI